MASFADSVSALRTFFGISNETPVKDAVASMNRDMGIVGEGTLPTQVQVLIGMTGLKVAAAPLATAQSPTPPPGPHRLPPPYMCPASLPSPSPSPAPPPAPPLPPRPDVTPFLSWLPPSMPRPPQPLRLATEPAPSLLPLPLIYTPPPLPFLRPASSQWLLSPTPQQLPPPRPIAPLGAAWAFPPAPAPYPQFPGPLTPSAPLAYEAAAASLSAPHGDQLDYSFMLVLPLLVLFIPLTLVAQRRTNEGARLAWKGDPHGDDHVHDPHNPFPLSVDPTPCPQQSGLVSAALAHIAVAVSSPARGLHVVPHDYERASATD